MNYKYPSWDIIHQLLPTSPDPETANESETLTNTSTSYVTMQIIPCVHKKHELYNHSKLTDLLTIFPLICTLACTLCSGVPLTMNTPLSLPTSFAPVWVLISLRFFLFMPKTKPLYCSGISTSSPDETSSAFKFLSWTACCKKVHFFTGNINATGRFKVYSVMHPRCYNNWWNKSGCYMRDSTFSCHLPLKSVLINMAESLSSKTTETKRSPKTTVIVEIKKIDLYFLIVIPVSVFWRQLRCYAQVYSAFCLLTLRESMGNGKGSIS